MRYKLVHLNFCTSAPFLCAHMAQEKNSKRTRLQGEATRTLD